MHFRIIIRTFAPVNEIEDGGPLSFFMKSMNKEKIIELFKENKELKTSQIAEILNLSLPRTRAILNEMIAEKILVSKGSNRNKIYFIEQ